MSVVIILNLRLYLINWYVLVTVFFTLNFFSVKISLTSVFFDILTNTYINDFYWNNFYFIWTQFFILPSLLIFLLQWYVIIFKKNKNPALVLLVMSMWCTMVWWVCEYYVLNQYFFVLKNIQYWFNNLLNNPLNKYHPILFFNAYIFLYNLASCPNFFSNSRSFQYITNQNYLTSLAFTHKLNYYWILILFSLYLGSWWALQEGSWGGWWNWDASEVFGLVILTFMLSILHTRTSPNFVLYWLPAFYLLNMSILFMYLVLQLSYTLVSHNFGLSLVGYGYVNVTFYVLLVLDVVCASIIVRLFLSKLQKLLHLKFYYSKFSKHYHKPNFYVLSHTTTLLTLLIHVVIYLYLTSFNPIINNIFWNSVSVDILNQWFVWVNFKNIVLTTLILLILQSNSLILIYISIYSFLFITYHPLILIYSSKNIFLKKNTHILIYIGMFVPLFLGSVLFCSWDLFNNSFVSYDNAYFRFIFRNNLFTENIYILDLLTSSKFFQILNSNSFFYFTSGLDTQFFDLDLNPSSLKQVIHNHTYLYTFKVTVWDQPSVVVDQVWLLIFISILVLLRLTCRIVF